MEMAGETEVMESKTIPPSDYMGHIPAAAPAQSTLNPLAAEKTEKDQILKSRKKLPKIAFWPWIKKIASS